MLQQAGLAQSLLAFERQGKKSGKVRVSLDNRMAAEFCIAHFQSCPWIRHNVVQAHIIGDLASEKEEVATAERKDEEVVTKYLPIKLQGQRVLHKILPETYQVAIPRSFWHLVGIAYRKSMNLHDRDDCGIDHGQIVRGKQINGWLAVKFNKSDGAADDTETLQPEAAFKPTATLQSRAAADDSGESTTLSQASVLEVSESELSSRPKSDSHGAETACPSNDDSEHSSQAQTSPDSVETADLAFILGKQGKLAWADIEMDGDDDNFGA
jgi:hypothetical protein